MSNIAFASSLLSVAESMVETLSTQYISDLEVSVNKHKTSRELLTIAEENGVETAIEEKEKLMKYIDSRDVLFKLLIVLWNQIRSKNPSKELVKKLLERYDEKAGEFLEYAREMSLENNIGDNDYLYECNVFKTERDRVIKLLTICNLI